MVEVAYVDLPVSALTPDESIPFDFDLWGLLNYTSDLFAVAENYSIQVDRYWTWETDVETFVLTTTDYTIEFDQYGGEFTGLVVNNSAGLIDRATVFVYLHDLETGEIVATSHDFIFEPIPEGNGAEYTVYVSIRSPKLMQNYAGHRSAVWFLLP